MLEGLTITGITLTPEACSDILETAVEAGHTYGWGGIAMDTPEYAHTPECDAANDRSPVEVCICPGGPDADPPAPFYFAAPYLVELAYGGPEEGGWYYDRGEPVEDDPSLPLPVMTHTEDDAYAACRAMQETLDATANVGLRPKHSVISTGVYKARVTPGYPRPFPAERPHYE